jgi:hypothetical protein
MAQQSFSTDLHFYKQDLPFTDLSQSLENAFSGKRHPVRLKIIIFDDRLNNAISSIQSTKVFKIAIINNGKHSISLELTETIKSKGLLKQLSGKIFITNHPVHKNIWLIITDGNGEFFNKSLNHLIRLIRPRCVAPILSTNQIMALSKAVEKLFHVRNARVREIGQSSKIVSQGADRKVEKNRNWTDITIYDVFQDVSNSKKWITDIRIAYDFGVKKKADVVIGNSGVIVFHRSIKTAFDVLIDRIAFYSFEWYGFLKNRSKNKQTNYRSRPFTIYFEESLFLSKDNIDHLNHTLRSISNTTCTVLHANPYYHSVMVDYSDGSTYEILVTNYNSISVLPQGRSTVSSLQRLCTKIFSEIKEGELKEGYA